MEIIGIIAEFNPLHNGHKHLINEVRRKYNPDLIVVALSSSFVQRGEPALLDKWVRTKMALDMGVDVVLELPFVFACQNAEIFAKGAVKILSEFGISGLAFGVENDDLHGLTKIAKAYTIDTPEFKSTIKGYLDKGMSYINSKRSALYELGYLNDADLLTLKKSNNILAIEYIKAINHFNKDILPRPILRVGVEHDSTHTVEEFTSASRIRESINKNESFDKYVPGELLRYFKDAIFPSDKILYSLLKYSLMDMKAEAITKTIDYEVGLENRILKYLDQASTLEELASMVATKRITKSRARRVLISSLLNVDKDTVKRALSGPPYTRVLGFNTNGSNYLRTLDIPRITNFKEIKNYPQIKLIGRIEENATNLYSILTGDPFKRDFTMRPIIKDA